MYRLLGRFGDIFSGFSLLLLVFAAKIDNGSSRCQRISGFACSSLRRSTLKANRALEGVPLCAKSRQNSRKGGRRGRRNIQTISDDATDNVETNRNQEKKSSQSLIKAPNKTKKCWVRLDRSKTSSPIDICLVEIKDASWWEQENNVNPYGARVWPPSLAAAKFLAAYLDQNDASKHHVVEVGCGTALVAMTAGACGATAVATDVSMTALSLAKQGWSETSIRLQQTETEIGDFSVGVFDLMSTSALPLSRAGVDEVRSATSESSIDHAEESTPRCILVASAVLYDKGLGKAMAKRAMEACDKGAWVILADDDTGLREGGRIIFEAEWQKLAKKHEKETGSIYRSQWTYETVKQKDVFGWADKKVQLLHLNHPELSARQRLL